MLFISCECQLTEYIISDYGLLDIAAMDHLASLIVTVLLPLLACSIYYCHHLKLQLGICSANALPRKPKCEPTLKPAIGFTPDAQNKTEYLINHGSSVWCKGSSNVDRMCTFHNLCYSLDFEDFVFVHAPHSVYNEVPEDRHRPALADLSSVPDHNTQYFNYIDVPSNKLESFRNLTYVAGKHLIFNRFNPGNLMHVIHDDLLPLFYTSLQLGHVHSSTECKQATLVMHDGQEEGEYFKLYALLSQNAPVLTHRLNHHHSGLVCFEEAHVGLSKSTVWYQYGFDIPQGPIDDVKVAAKEIRLFTSFIKSKLNITDCPPNLRTEEQQTFVILSRRSNRLILNEVELSLALAQHFDVQVLTASLETHTMEELIQLISCCHGLVTVHGSVLSLSVFLSPGTLLIEIFPYAVNPDHYTPYRTLSELEGMNIIYKSWRNVDVESTVTHTDAEPEFGGIAHLSAEKQNQIVTSVEVPLHLCCKDPEWLFRIYQDTVVNVESFLEVVQRGFEDVEKQVLVTESVKVTLYPGPVRGASCHSIRVQSKDVKEANGRVELGLVLSWQPPWNLPSIHHDGGDYNVQYEVLIQEQGEGDLYGGAFILPMTYHTFTGSFQQGSIYYAWVRCRIGDRAGPYISVTSCPYKENLSI